MGKPKGSEMRGSEAHYVFVIMDELVSPQKLQSLIDLLQIKPLLKADMVLLVLEAMDRIVIEIFNIYRNIC